jgi:hypothetical protein
LRVVTLINNQAEGGGLFLKPRPAEVAQDYDSTEGSLWLWFQDNLDRLDACVFTLSLGAASPGEDPPAVAGAALRITRNIAKIAGSLYL